MSIIQQLIIVKFFLPAPGYFDFHGSSLLSLHYNPQKESMNLTTGTQSFLHCFSNGVQYCSNVSYHLLARNETRIARNETCLAGNENCAHSLEFSWAEVDFRLTA